MRKPTTDFGIPWDIDSIASGIVRTDYSNSGEEPDWLFYRAIADAILAERQRSAKIAAAEVMRFRSKVAGKYYPGYHEDLRDAVSAAVLNVRSGQQSQPHSKANTPRQTSPVVETVEAQRGADASKVVCRALIDDVGGF